MPTRARPACSPLPGGATVTFSPGFGTTSALNNLGRDRHLAGGRAGHADRGKPGARPLVPAIATQAFDDANHTGPGQTVSATVSGITIPVRIVAQVDSFPTVTGSGLIMDLTTLQSLLVAQRRRAARRHAVVAGDRGPRGAAGPGGGAAAGPDVTSRAAVAAATANDPLSAAPQQALLAVAAAAALLAITGFLVSIAANVRQRRAENALLAALGVAPAVRRGAALPGKAAAVGAGGRCSGWCSAPSSPGCSSPRSR